MPTLVSNRVVIALGSWREFDHRDDANAWRNSTKEADKHKIFNGG